MKKLLINCLFSLCLAQVGVAQSFPNLLRAPDGRAFVLPSSKSKDTSWVKVRGENVVIEKALPLKSWASLDVKVNVSADGGYFNAQGLPAETVISYRYSIDGGKKWFDRAWEWKLSPGTYTVRCEFNRPGFVTGYAEKQFTIPGKPTGNNNLPTDPGTPSTKPGGGSPKPKPDENRTGEEFTDALTSPIQPSKRLRYVPRLLVQNPTRTVDPALEQVRPFQLSGINTIYGDVNWEAANLRGWKRGFNPGLPADRNTILLYSDVWRGTNYRRGISDESEIPLLIQKAVEHVSGWRDTQGRAPRYIADDHEKQAMDPRNPDVKLEDGESKARFERIRGAIHRGLKAAFPESLVGNYGIENIGNADPVEFEGGKYVVLNLFYRGGIIDACQAPDLWRTSTELYGEYVFEKIEEGRKAIAMRAEGREFITAFWNRWRDGCNVDGYMTIRDDVAEGQILFSVLAGSQSVWLWNAHPCQTPGCVPTCQPNCDPFTQHLSGTLHATAALERLSAISPLLDGGQEYFLPEVSVDGVNYVAQTGEYTWGGKSDVYRPIEALGGDLWTCKWPDNLPVVAAIRNKGKVALVAVFPRQTNPDALKQVWVRSVDFGDTFVLKGRQPMLFTDL